MSVPYNFVMRGWDSVGGAYVRWTSIGRPDFSGDFYVTGTGPAFGTLTDISVERRMIAAAGGPSVDWRRLPGVLGIGGEQDLNPADYVDLNVVESGGVALASPPALTERGQIGLEAFNGTNLSDMCGVKIVDAPAGDFTVAYSGTTMYAGRDYYLASTPYIMNGLAGFKGTDTATNDGFYMTKGRVAERSEGAGYASFQFTGGRANPSTYLTNTDGGVDYVGRESWALCRRGSNWYWYDFSGGSWFQVVAIAAAHAGAMTVALMTLNVHNLSVAPPATTYMRVFLENLWIRTTGEPGAGYPPGWDMAALYP